MFHVKQQGMTEQLTACPVCNRNSFQDVCTVQDYFLTQEKFQLVKCTGCEFVFVNPRPDAQSIGRYYQSNEYISHDASGKNLISLIYKAARRYAIQGKVNLIRRYDKSGGTVLDYGCGTGEFLAQCSRNGMSVAGVEPNEKAREFAATTHAIPVFPSLEATTMKPRSVRVITLWHVLEHIHSLNETTASLCRLLADDGTLIVAVPNHTSKDAQTYGQFWAAYDVPRHIYHFTGNTIRQFFSGFGFRVKEVLPQPLDAFYVSMLSEKYKHGKNNYPGALINGLRSNWAARDPLKGYSSQIYILQREIP